jgi:hypothetical protein
MVDGLTRAFIVPPVRTARTSNGQDRDGIHAHSFRWESMVVRIHNCTVLHTSARRTRNDVRPNVLWRGFYWSLGAYFAFFLLRGFLR